MPNTKSHKLYLCFASYVHHLKVKEQMIRLPSTSRHSAGGASVPNAHKRKTCGSTLLVLWLNAWVLCISATAQPAGDDERVSDWISRYTADQRTLDHRFRIPLDEVGFNRRIDVAERWLARLKEKDFAQLSRVEQIDYLLFRGELQYQIEYQRLERERDLDAVQLMPYAKKLVAFCVDRENVEAIEGRKLAESLDAVAEQIELVSASLVESPARKQESTGDASGPIDETARTQRRLTGLRA
ncbi:MAG: hypothetical protein AAGG44_14175, partial [Planctomycetota bacterium]